MWTKTDRFIFSVGIYNYLINPNMDNRTIIDWRNIMENSIYNNPENDPKELEDEELIEPVKLKFQKFLENEEFYLSKISTKLQKIKETPELVIAILISFSIEVEELQKQNSNIEQNFSLIVKSYSRMTQDLIGTDYMMLVNSIIRNR